MKLRNKGPSVPTMLLSVALFNGASGSNPHRRIWEAKLEKERFYSN